MTIIFSYLLYKSSEKTRQLNVKVEERERKKYIDNIRQNSLIVYYDLKLGIQDIINIYMYLKFNKIINTKISKPEKIYLSKDWIKNVAALDSILQDNSNKSLKRPIENIYRLYGDLQTIQNRLDSNKSNNDSFNDLINDIVEDILSEKVINKIREKNKIIQQYSNSRDKYQNLDISPLKTKLTEIFNYVDNILKNNVKKCLNNEYKTLLKTLEELTRYNTE